MKNLEARDRRITGRILPIVGAAALAAALTVSLPGPARADRVTPPHVPENLQAPAGSRAFLEGHAFGTQNYVCLPSGAGYAWSLFTPQATLFADHGRQLTTHFFSPNPVEGGTVRPAWQHSLDSSTVWGAAIQSSADPAFVAPGAIPWLLIRVVGAQHGPIGGGRLTKATSIQRVNTSGGLAPSTGCSLPTDVGRRAFVPYTADYVFYSGGESEEE